MGHIQNNLNGLSRRIKSREKASRRLRWLIAKAKRWGLTTEELGELPTVKKLLPNRTDLNMIIWTSLAIIALVLGWGIMFLYICTTPCVCTKKMSRM